MDLLDTFGKEKIIDLLNRCWMTHDGMWFFHCLKEFGIEKANEMNRAAISSLAPIEIARMKDALGIEKEKIATFEEFKDFFSKVSNLFIPDFMNINLSFQAENILHWEFEKYQCFAYKGMERVGIVDQYRCGVIYRLECWFDSLGLEYAVMPQPDRCLMLDEGNCFGNIRFWGYSAFSLSP